MTPRYITIKGGRSVRGNPEADSDRNEDEGREMQLDRSFDDWVMQRIEDQTNRQHSLTNVPNGNAIEAAENLDETEEKM